MPRAAGTLHPLLPSCSAAELRPLSTRMDGFLAAPSRGHRTALSTTRGRCPVGSNFQPAWFLFHGECFPCSPERGDVRGRPRSSGCWETCVGDPPTLRRPQPLPKAPTGDGAVARGPWPSPSCITAERQRQGGARTPTQPRRRGENPQPQPQGRRRLPGSPLRLAVDRRARTRGSTVWGAAGSPGAAQGGHSHRAGPGSLQQGPPEGAGDPGKGLRPRTCRCPGDQPQVRLDTEPRGANGA